MSSGTRSTQAPCAGLGAWHDRDDQEHADEGQREAGAHDDRGPPAPGARPGDQRDEEHAQRQRGDRQASLQRVVLQRDLQEDRDDDHRAAEGDLLKHLLGDPDAEVAASAKSPGSSRNGLPSRLRRTSQRASPKSPTAPTAMRAQHRLAALLPHQDAQHDAAHAHDRQRCADSVDASVPGVGDVLDEPDAQRARRR